MRIVKNILLIQTAFLGDVILTLPLVQVLKKFFAHAEIHMLTVPRAAGLVENHPCIDRTIIFDKRDTDAGVGGLLRLTRLIRSVRYDVAFVPHRSVRSALVAWLGRIPIRIGFRNSFGRYLYTAMVPFSGELHEVERCLSLLGPLGIDWGNRELPTLYPSEDDRRRVDHVLFELEIVRPSNLIGVAPGTVWKTKRWLPERYADLSKLLAQEQFEVVLIGGEEDVDLCRSIAQMSGSSHVYSTAGRLTLLQSADLIRRCRAVVSNDSASMHIAVAMRTPVVAIFGATVPEFGFYPYGSHDVVVETHALSCRPCSKHGGDVCPIKTFECMTEISHFRVFDKVQQVLRQIQV